MKYFIWILASINLYFGINSFLNAVHILQSSKYSQASTVVFAILFLGIGIAAFYFSLIQNNNKIALWICIGPWLLAILFLLINMITGDYK